MTSFGWKKATPVLKKFELSKHKKNLSLGNVFEQDSKANTNDEVSAVENDCSESSTEYDWCTALKKRKLDYSLETDEEKLLRLKNEGIALAEKEEYWQAIGRWDDALQLLQKSMLTNETAKLYHEMKSQALMQLHEWEPAIESAERAIKIDPKWYSSHQTLGRAHLGIGNVLEAIKAFSRARHICPDDEEIKVEDLEWASSLLIHQKLMAAAREINNTNDSDIITNATN